MQLEEMVQRRDALSVMQLTTHIKDIIESDIILSRVRVRGEISNYKYHSSGHMYFTLKDENAKIKCVMFRGYNAFLKFRPEDGMRIIIEGNISVYEKDGQYQLYCSRMEPDGVGELYLAYEQLKERLNKEGLFDEATKLPIPFLPRKIGVVTSPTGAVIRDIINVASKRFYNINILLYPVKVQGQGAAESIKEAIEFFNLSTEVDVIIIGRGGGSIEELWAFNEEVVARAINKSKVPIISAVGHETDFTIADFVADVRASTPSQAAEIAVPSLQEVLFKISSIQERVLSKYENFISKKCYYIKSLAENIDRNSPKNRIVQFVQQIDNIQSRITLITQNKLAISSNQFKGLVGKLDALSPIKTLSRGYSIATRDKKVINSIKELQPNSNIRLYLKDGKAECKIVEISEGSLW